MEQEKSPFLQAAPKTANEESAADLQALPPAFVETLKEYFMNCFFWNQMCTVTFTMDGKPGPARVFFVWNPRPEKLVAWMKDVINSDFAVGRYTIEPPVRDCSNRLLDSQVDLEVSRCVSAWDSCRIRGHFPRGYASFPVNVRESTPGASVFFWRCQPAESASIQIAAASCHVATIYCS